MISSRLARPGLGAALIVLSGSAASAHDTTESSHGRGMFLERFFEKLDTDGDGAVSKAEAEQAGEEIFVALDGDGDGVLSEQEFMEPKVAADPGAKRLLRWKKHRARRFAAMDQDGDGAVTPEEQADFGDARFARADADGNGLLTIEEMRALHKKRGQP